MELIGSVNKPFMHTCAPPKHAGPVSSGRQLQFQPGPFTTILMKAWPAPSGTEGSSSQLPKPNSDTATTESKKVGKWCPDIEQAADGGGYIREEWERKFCVSRWTGDRAQRLVSCEWPWLCFSLLLQHWVLVEIQKEFKESQVAVRGGTAIQNSSMPTKMLQTTELLWAFIKRPMKSEA